MSLAIVSLATREVFDYSQYTYTINRAYCEKHKIPFFGYNDSLDHSRHPVWSKMLALGNHVLDFDYLVWIDADAAIMNHNKTFNPYLQSDYMVQMGKDSNGWNAGVFILKGGAESLSWLQFIYKQTQFTNHKWREQQAMVFSFGLPQYKDTVLELPRHEINAYFTNAQANQYKEGDFILHTPANDLQTRTSCFRPFADELNKRE